MPATPPPSRRAPRQPARGRPEQGGQQRRGQRRPAAAADEAGTRYRSRSERAYELPKGISEELHAALGEGPARAKRRAETVERLMANAALSYERDRYTESLASIRLVIESAPTSATARELYGLVLYRLGRWRQAAKELRQFHELSGSFDQHPVIADCERALGHFSKVDEIWTELRRAGVDRDVLVEGRLVLAGTLADQGKLNEAIELLGPEGRSRKNPDLAHLRTWYALGDLYERAGDLPRARELFRRVAEAAPDALDAPARLAALR
jgi:tetratricopeptide (TPR) repeat protein